MKDAILALLVSAVAALVLWNNTSNYEDTKTSEIIPVQADVTQVILEEVQKTEVDMVPIETLFVNAQGDNVYNARFMFLNTTGFFGVQYDVQAKVNPSGSATITAITQTARPDYSSAYVPDKYQSYNVIRDNLNKQLGDAIASYNEAQKKQNK